MQKQWKKEWNREEDKREKSNFESKQFKKSLVFSSRIIKKAILTFFILKKSLRAI